MNKELHLLYNQDQADRFEVQKLTRERIMHRDRIRRQRVEELRVCEALQTSEDFFHAAMIFQHGETLNHYWMAHELAKKGANLGHLACRRLTAATYDRWLMRQGRPQMYGTQYVLKEGRWVLYDVEPTTTDAQRAELDVPLLAQALQQAEEMNQSMPPSFFG